jgi:2-keto-4-pentenoate hydratase/2-oxohepta-3-ene-1,7-dioic acid hydratase in catechol pathway
MKLYTFEADGQARVGVERNGKLIDVTAVAPTMLELVEAGEAGLNQVRKANGSVYAFDQIRILAPINPGKILCSGINYRGHLEENPGAKLPESPFFFAKLPNTVIGPGQPIIHPKMTQQLDYEVEFTVVIGKRLSDVAENEVMSAIFGYTILHDVSARDVQFKDNQITLGKNFDTFAPIGPCIVTPDEIPNLANVRLRSLVNSEVMQDGSTQDWVFTLPALVRSLSRVMTLEPGDLVTTGTPAGVGVFRKPQVFLKPGDVVALEVEGIGRLENPVTSA